MIYDYTVNFVCNSKLLNTLVKDDYTITNLLAPQPDNTEPMLMKYSQKYI